MEKFICQVCGYVYDPAIGEPDSGIETGIPFGAISEDWNCPQCNAPQSEFEAESGTMPGMVAPIGE